MKKIFFIFFILTIFVFSASSALALDPLVPACGRAGAEPCTTCDILVLGKNISDFILFYLVPALSALFFIWAGFEILLGGGIPGRVKKGQDIFRTTVYGLLIIFLSWMIVNTVLRTVAGDQNIAENWWKLECRETVTGVTTTIETVTPNPENNPSTSNPPNPSAITMAVSSPIVRITTPPTSLTFTGTNLPANTAGTVIMTKDGASRPSQSFNTGSPGSLKAVTFRADSGDEGTWTIKIRMPDGKESNTVTFMVVPPVSTTDIPNPTLTTNPPPPPPPPVKTTNPPPPGSLACKYSGVNLCQGPASSCSQDTCSQYSAAIQKAAASALITGINSAALIRAVMFNESSCNVAAKSNSDPPSCGLVQLQPATANRFKSQCGIKDNITCDWLRSSENAEASICIGAKYLKSLANGTCGNQVRNIAAGYNSGAGNCSASNDCKNEKSCDNSVVRKWECLYDNPQHTVCNTRLDETKNYAPKVQACYNAINK